MLGLRKRNRADIPTPAAGSVYVTVDEDGLLVFKKEDGSVVAPETLITELGDSSADDLASAVSTINSAIALKQDASSAATDTELAAEKTAREGADTTNAAAASAAQATANAALPKAGGTMTGKITLDGDPTANLHPATRQYVTSQIAAVINGAPGALDTLKEIADQLASDESAVSALTTVVSGKAGKTSNLSDLTDAAAARTNISAASVASVTAEESRAKAVEAVKADLEAGRLKVSQLPTPAISAAATGGVPAWAAKTTYAINALVTAAETTFICLKAHESGAVFPGVGENWAVFGSGSNGDLLFPSTNDTLATPDPVGKLEERSLTSGWVHWIGGRGCRVKAGRTVGGIEWLNWTAAAGATMRFFVLGLPDENGYPIVTIVAVSKEDTAAAWAAETRKKLSLAVADGGTGVWTPSADTPVMIGICEINTTTIAKIPGVNFGREKYAEMQPAQFYTHNPKNLASSAGLVGGAFILEPQAVAYPCCRLTESTV